MKRDGFIFHDRSGYRWLVIRILTLIGLILGLAGLIVFVQTLWIKPRLRLPASIHQVRQDLRSIKTPMVTAASSYDDTRWLKEYETLQSRLKRQAKIRSSLPPASRSNGVIRLGYYVTWDPNSYTSLVNHGWKLTHLCPEWFSLGKGGRLLEATDPKAFDAATAYGLMVLPMLDNSPGDHNEPELVESLLKSNEGRQKTFIDSLVLRLKTLHAGGVVLNWPGVSPASRNALTVFIERLARSLHENKLELWVQVSPGADLEAFDISAIAPSADRLVAMLHQQHSPDNPPGPLSARPWFDRWLKDLTAQTGPEHWVVVLGNYACDWPDGGENPELISFADAMSRAAGAGVVSATVTPPYQSPYFRYSEKQHDHSVWFLDAVTFFNQARQSRHMGCAGVGLHRLGMEDPLVWKILAQPDTASGELEYLPTEKLITNVGDGEFITVFDEPHDGWRSVWVEKTGDYSAVYDLFPLYTILYHQGEGRAHEVVLTFDDGPDAEWTPRVLDILREKKVPAAFFIVGMQAEKNPALLGRILQEGHEIGNHTYMHPNLAGVSDERTMLELNATQRLVESMTGRSTILFRPPYNADSRPNERREIEPIKLAQEAGYITVCENIDPEDWQNPGTGEIVHRILDQRHHGSIILLHDAGGDRQQTLEALPLIIDALRARGDHFVSLGQLLGLPPELVMPPSAADDHPALWISGTGFRILHVCEEFIWAFMIVATALVLLRAVIIIALALRYRDPSTLPSVSPVPGVSVIIAAYNEEKVIVSTLSSLRATDYPGVLEILVVDDGSADTTADLVESLTHQDSRIRLIRQPNTGKAAALENAFLHARHPVIVTLDADTQFEPLTISALVRALHAPGIGAVSGHARVGNTRSWVARCQSLEYICGFNLDRRAYHVLDAITVVPGAVSAWRREAVTAAGGFLSDTLAEDTDLTLKLHRAGWEIAYCAAAVAWTEAPETLGSLIKQRLRWCFGTMQCLWKNLDMTLNPFWKSLGLFSLPSLWFFQIILVAVAPLVDLLLILSLFFGGGAEIYFYIGIFLLVDLLLAAVACLMEGEPLSESLLILPMRLVYRPVLSYVVWKSLIRALRGAWVGWHKLERTASVSYSSKKQPPL